VARIVLILAVVLLLLLVWLYYRRLNPQQQQQWLKQVLILVALGIILVLAATGRLNWLFALVASVIPLIPRMLHWLVRNVPGLLPLMQRYQQHRRAAGPKQGQSSSVETAVLKMTLDHDTGAMDGVILTGSMTGKRLSELNLEQLLQLYQSWAADEETTALLIAYLDKTHPNWQAQVSGTGEQQETRSRQAMNKEEALEVLGLKPGASREEILEAHRRLIQKVHPDRGGTDYLAARINQAKDVLLA